MDHLVGQDLLNALSDRGERVRATWTPLPDGMHARWSAPDPGAALSFATTALGASEEGGAPLLVTLGAGLVTLHLPGVPQGSVRPADLDLAQQLVDDAAAAGLERSGTVASSLELALDTADADSIRPFWAALLAPVPDERTPGTSTQLSVNPENIVAPDVVDPTGQHPLLWFQETEPHPTPRQRMHVDVWLDPRDAPARIRAAVAAGGTVVDESGAPSFTVLADPEGNRACICTVAER